MIINDVNKIVKNNKLKEKLEKESKTYEFIGYQSSINFYDMSVIDYHWHDEFEIFVLDSGSVYIEVNGKPFILNEHEGCVINSNAIHYFKALSHDCHFRSFVFHPQFISGKNGSHIDIKYVQPFIQGAPSYYIFFKDHPFYQYFDDAFGACVDEYTGYELDVRHYFSKIMISCLNELPVIKEHDDSRIKEMIEWIDDNFYKPLSVLDIANSQNMSIRECQRIFSKSIHLSPMEYLRRKRIIKATELLVDSDMSITDIALYLHFSSSSHFSKVFKELIGCTPLKYRKNKSFE